MQRLTYCRRFVGDSNQVYQETLTVLLEYRIEKCSKQSVKNRTR